MSLAVETVTVANDNDTTEDVEPAPVEVAANAGSSLSVTTDMKRDEPLYEPVSPTPLPDSPSDDQNKVVTAATDNKPSPFQEVINKKAAGAGAPAEQNKDEDNFELIRLKKGIIKIVGSLRRSWIAILTYGNILI